jgi:hypothetical protein
MIDKAELWLDHEDQGQREERIRRLRWLVGQDFPLNSMVFGGARVHDLFEEAKYCFVYGQYLSSILCISSVVERALIGQFFAPGEDQAETWTFQRAIQEAGNRGIISSEDREFFDRLRQLRNPLVHFRRPLERDTLEFRVLENESEMQNIKEEDAKFAVLSMIRLMKSFSV